MNKMLLLALGAIIYIKTSQFVKATPGQPVPHAEVLEDLLSKYLGDSYSNNSLFDFILGQPSQDRDNLTEDYLDISILDVNNLRKTIALAKKKYANKIMAPENSRRAAPYNKYPKSEAYHWHPYVVNKTFELMKHSMYMTKEKINLTRPFRQKYNRQIGYQIGVLYQAAAATLGKMEALYNQMLHFKEDRTQFIWFLIMYERILSCNIDIGDAIEKIFLIHGDFEQVSPAKAAKGNLTQAQMKEMMKNPQLAAQNKDAMALLNSK